MKRILHTKEYKLNRLITRDRICYERIELLLTKAKTLLNWIRENSYTISQNNSVSYRIINHWSSEGLIDDHRKKDSHWRKFSLKDMTWHEIILELRSFGFPNKKILKTKKAILDLQFDKKYRIEYPLFEYYLALAFIVNKPVYLLVFNDGFAEMADYIELQKAEQERELTDSYIRIFINPIIQKLFYAKNIEPITKPENIIPSEEELKIINLIREGSYKQIIIKFDKGKPHLLEMKQEIKTEQKIIDIIRKKGYQDIQIKTADGNIVSLQTNIKEKLNAMR
jgi:DNA-binding transcriptional MerR regulator